MKWQQATSVMTPLALPSSEELWCSLRLQLMVELQRMARERRLTILEEQEFVLTQTMGLTMQERCWLEQTHKLVSIMPPPACNEVIQYNISSYLPKVIPHPEVRPPPLTLISLTANPPLKSTSMRMPESPPMVRLGPLTLTTPTPHLQCLCD